MAALTLPPEMVTLLFHKMDASTLLAASLTCQTWNNIFEGLLTLDRNRSNIPRRQLTIPQFICIKKWREIERCQTLDSVGILSGKHGSGKRLVAIKSISNAENAGKTTLLICRWDSAVEWKRACRLIDDNISCVFAADDCFKDHETLLPLLQKSSLLCISAYKATTLQKKLDMISSFPNYVHRVMIDCLDDFLPDKGTWLAKLLLPMKQWKKWIVGTHVDECIGSKAFCKEFSHVSTIHLQRDCTVQQSVLHNLVLCNDQDDIMSDVDILLPTKCCMPWNQPKLYTEVDIEVQLVNHYLNDNSKVKFANVTKFLVERCIQKRERCIVVGFLPHTIEHLMNYFSDCRELQEQFATYAKWIPVSKRLKNWEKYMMGDVNILLCQSPSSIDISFPNTNHIIFVEPASNKQAFNTYLDKCIHPSDATSLQCWHFLYHQPLEMYIFEWITLDTSNRTMIQYVRDKMGMF